MPTDTLPEVNPAKRYSAALDSVNLINDRIAAALPDQTSEQRRSDIDRNVEHLKIAVAWDIWTTEDLTLFISQGNHHTFVGLAVGTAGRHFLTFFAQNDHRLLKITIGFGECLFAIHHAGTGLLPQLINVSR